MCGSNFPYVTSDPPQFAQVADDTSRSSYFDLSFIRSSLIRLICTVLSLVRRSVGRYRATGSDSPNRTYCGWYCSRGRLVLACASVEFFQYVGVFLDSSLAA